MKKQLLFPLIGFIMVACSGDKENESKNEKKSFCDCIELSIENAMQAKEAPEGCDWIKNLSFEEKEKKINTNCPDLMGYLKIYEDLPGNVENTDKEKEVEKKSFCDCMKEAIKGGGDEAPKGCEWIDEMSEEEIGMTMMKEMQDCPELKMMMEGAMEEYDEDMEGSGL